MTKPKAAVNNSTSSSAAHGNKSKFRRRKPRAERDESKIANVRDDVSHNCDATNDSGLAVLDVCLHPLLASHAKKTFQLEELTDVQVRTIPAILQADDLIVKSRTGTGKTLAYCLPLIQVLQQIDPPINRSFGPVAIVLLPTRELSMQTFDVIQALVKPFIRIVPACLIGGTNRKHEKDRIRKGVNILIGTPGRIEDHVDNTASLDLSQVRHLILDEADRMLDMGFQKSMELILRRVQETASQTVQKVLLSATISSKMHWLTTIHMNNPQFIDVDTIAVNQSASFQENGEEGMAEQAHGGGKHDGVDVSNSLPVHLRHFYLSVPFKQRLCALVAFILRKCRRKGRVKIIVFLSTNDSVLFHYYLLNHVLNGSDDVTKRNVEFMKLHGSMALMDRRKTLIAFSTQRCGVLLCTDVAARGLDFKQVGWIVQYNGPQTIVDYIHRSGRTARLNETGKVVIFLDPMETQYVNRLLDLGIRVKPISLPMLLKSIADEKQSAHMLNRKLSQGIRAPSLSAIDRICQNRVQQLQYTMEQAVQGNEELKEFARSAYASFIKSYATYGREFKGIFHTRNLHLGHVAKSFALRETPSEIMRACIFRRPRDESMPPYERYGQQPIQDERLCAPVDPLNNILEEFDSGL